MSFLSQLFSTRLLNGTNCNDIVLGTICSDYMRGYAGNDTMYGFWGNDTLNGGEGADLLDGGSGIDTATYENAKSGVGVHMGNPSVNFGEAAGDKYVSIENIRGSSYNDELVADGQDNTVWGGNGNDSIFLNGGNDVGYGEAGNDRLWGNDGNDKLFGGADNDEMWGGTGNDCLDGGTGNDFMVGEAGKDTFIFDGKTGGVDTIGDFTSSGADADLIQLRGFGSVDTFDELKSLMTEWNGNTYISLNNGNELALMGVSICQLSADDFCFA